MRIGVIPVLLLLSTATGLSAEARLRFSYTPDVDASEEILESLADGHRAEIHYEARVYRRSHGIARVFGDRLVAETEIIYNARWDELNRRYVVRVGDSEEIAFDDPEACTTFLLSLSDLTLPIPVEAAEDIYLLCRAQIEPIRLVPPLTLLTFLMPGFRTVTPWTETFFERIES